MTDNTDENDIWFHYTTQSANDLTVNIEQALDVNENDACVIAEVKKCNASGDTWADCASGNRKDVGLIWNCPIVGTTNPSVDLTIGLNKLIRVEVSSWPSGPSEVEYIYSMFPN